MKKLLLLMLLAFTTIASANEELLSFPFTPDNVKDWKYFSDQVMGGVSEGQVSLEQDGDKVFIRLSGNVRTDNNGGFIQLRTSTSLSNKPMMFKLLHNSNKEGKKLKGIRLKVKGNGEKYHVFIQTTIFYRLPTGYQIATFDTSPNWETVEIPFNTFKKLKDNIDSNISAKDIKTFGIVAYGRDFRSDLSVSSVEFYY
ncbi:MAG: hypothetical protein HOL25_00365 [Gammaproteobacteria bacterium]|nr:hypothetical protein [Gammaproteobacteria bacterium]